MEERYLFVGAFADGKYIQHREQSTSDEAIISFVAPSNTGVKIVVYSLVGESKDHFGTLAIKITKVQ